MKKKKGLIIGAIMLCLILLIGLIYQNQKEIAIRKGQDAIKAIQAKMEAERKQAELKKQQEERFQLRWDSAKEQIKFNQLENQNIKKEVLLVVQEVQGEVNRIQGNQLVIAPETLLLLNKNIGYIQEDNIDFNDTKGRLEQIYILVQDTKKQSDYETCIREINKIIAVQTTRKNKLIEIKTGLLNIKNQLINVQ